MERIKDPLLMEPLLPAEGTRELEDLAIELVALSSRLAGKLAPETIQSISDIVRSMNCYYSNLIEGHNTHPVDIEKALRRDYSQDRKKRDLQLEASAHIEVQSIIDRHNEVNIISKDYICWIHKEFCDRLPKDLLRNHDPKTGKEVKIVPGALRDGEVIVGNHLAPLAENLPLFFKLFEERYDPQQLSAVMRIVAVAASHHRLLWIHPFFDGNGRVARLFSHSFLKGLGIGNGLWSISRGLARNVGEYKNLLSAADRWRENDTDGRGSLSLRGLTEFCVFFLKTCIDQIKFMESLLEPLSLIERVRRFCDEQTEKRVLPRGSFEVLRELIFAGSIPRSRLTTITGYQERNNRLITAALLKHELIKTASPRADLKLHVPYAVVEKWFPRLYPADLG